MNYRYTATITTLATCALLMTGCTGSPKAPASNSSPTASSSVTTAKDDTPKVAHPMPAKVLDGSPCDSALTADQLSTFLGQATAAERKDNTLGPECHWGNAAGSGAGINVTYQTKSDQGIRLAYQNVQPKAARWKVLDPIQGYPAVAYSDFDDKRHCVIVVAVNDELAYSVALTLGDKATSDGKDSFDIGPDVASAVMTNVKARA